MKLRGFMSEKEKKCGQISPQGPREKEPVILLMPIDGGKGYAEQDGRELPSLRNPWWGTCAEGEERSQFYPTTHPTGGSGGEKRKKKRGPRSAKVIGLDFMMRGTLGGKKGGEVAIQNVIISNQTGQSSTYEKRKGGGTSLDGIREAQGRGENYARVLHSVGKKGRASSARIRIIHLRRCGGKETVNRSPRNPLGRQEGKQGGKRATTIHVPESCQERGGFNIV